MIQSWLVQVLRFGIEAFVLRARRSWRRGAGAAAAIALSGCAGLPVIDRQPIVSTAIPLSDQTTLGRIASAYRPAEDHSGFRLMPLGTFSLDSRVQLARRAEVSLDVQYYHFELDETGRWLLRALRDAANRARAIDIVRTWLAAQPGWRIVDVVTSPGLQGRSNEEYLIGAHRDA